MVTQLLAHVLRPDRVGGGVGVWRTPRHNPHSGFRLPFHSWDLTNLPQAQEPRLAHLAHLRRISNDRPFDRFIYQRSLPLLVGLLCQIPLVKRSLSHFLLLDDDIEPAALLV